MSKRIGNFLVVAVMLVFVALTVLGKKMLPTAPVRSAWRAPFGTAGNLSVLRETVPVGSERAEVEALLGEPSGELVGITNSGRFSLIFGNPHDSSGSSCLVSFDEDGRVMPVEAFRE